jgi:hypothetical protein
MLSTEKAKTSVAPKELNNEKVQTEDADAPTSFTPFIKYQKLEFKVDTFFAVGSPLGVFLALRNIRLGIGNTYLCNFRIVKTRDPRIFCFFLVCSLRCY